MIEQLKESFLVFDTKTFTRYLKERDLEDSEKFVLRELFGAKNIFITPQILAEMAYFIEEKFGGWEEDEIEILLKIFEKYVEKTAILQSDAMKKFGISDASIIILADTFSGVIITYDWKLADWCRKNGISAFHMHEIINFV
ncbi:MAG: hypothetical protein HYW25_05455 [Candidatus Aenigmarchaeota archaeon]|nr:hypothetical protein [Candidatus Aenigmarchaeota archaeon]